MKWERSLLLRHTLWFDNKITSEQNESQLNDTMEDYKFLFKVVLVGNAGVGKTCLVRRFTQGMFPPGQGATIGVDFMIKTVEIEGEKIKVRHFLHQSKLFDASTIQHSGMCFLHNWILKIKVVQKKFHCVICFIRCQKV